MVSSVDDIVLNSERSNAPLTLQLEVALDRAIGSAAISDAWAQVVRAHPIGGVRLVAGRSLDRKRYWRRTRLGESDASVAAVSGDLGHVRRHFYSDGLSLVDRPAVTMGVLDEGRSCRLLFRGHHGALDGRSLAMIVGQLLAVLSGELVSPGEAGAVEDTPGKRSSRIVSLRQVAARRAPTRVGATGGTQIAGYGIASRTVDQAVLKVLVDQLDCRFTVNDLLVAALHRTIATWNRLRSLPADLVTVTVPFDLRSGPDDLRLGNLSSQLSTGSTTLTRGNTGLLLTNVHATVSQHREMGRTDPSVTAGSAALLPVVVRRAIPRVGALLTRDRFLDSSRLSNLGRLEGSGWSWNAITGVYFSVPTRMPQGVALGAVTHAGTLHLGLRWCNALFDTAAGDAFIELYLRELASLTDGS